MDRIRQFREMSTRRIVALAFAGAALPVLVLCVLAAWLLPAELADGGAGVPVAAVWTILAVAVLAAVIPWWMTDRLLEARLHDRRSLPARPEFFDFHDLNQPMHWDEMGGKSLKELRFVVFDTETTGLRPSQGDEIISIAAVRIENGEIDEAGAFSRLVNPGIPIPPASIKFHGITDDMVNGEAGIAEVLPSFRDYVGDAILVAHNAAFDMTFLRLKEEQTGTVFSNLVLDTLLMNVFLEHESENHSLDSIAERMGIRIEGRHTALGDSIATARVFLKMLNRLEARGITALRQVVDASAKIEHVRKLRDRF